MNKDYIEVNNEKYYLVPLRQKFAGMVSTYNIYTKDPGELEVIMNRAIKAEAELLAGQKLVELITKKVSKFLEL